MRPGDEKLVQVGSVISFDGRPYLYLGGSVFMQTKTHQSRGEAIVFHMISKNFVTYFKGVWVMECE